MATTWKVNGVALADSGLRNLVITYDNMQADTCEFEDPDAAFDADPRFAFDAAITITRRDDGDPDEYGVFKGRIAQAPRFLGTKAESIRYVAHGRWADLDRRAFQQKFQYAVNPTDPASTLHSFPQGICVLSQADDGTKLALADALAYVVQKAVDAGADIELGSITGFDFEIPWDEVADLSCAKALTRLLALVPDAVVYFNYAATPPKMTISRRASLDALSVPIAPAGEAGLGTAYAALESIELTPLNQLLASGVFINYLRTDRSNARSWVVRSVDKFPNTDAVTGDEADCLVRTVQLAGAVQQGTNLRQTIEVGTIPTTALGLAADHRIMPFASRGGSSGDTDDNAFYTLLEFFRRNVPDLKHPWVKLLALESAEHVLAADSGEGVSQGSPDASLVNYLTAGAITPWMIDNLGIAAEEQEIRVLATVLIYRDADGNLTNGLVTNGKIETAHWPLKVRIRATAASGDTYSFLADESYTAPEAPPTGLAENLYGALSTVHYDGRLVLHQAEASIDYRPGVVINLTDSRAEWATSRMMVQKARLSVDDGRTLLTVGWPRQLMPADLTQVWRANRGRRPVTSYLTRVSGVTGTDTAAQDLGLHHFPATGSAAHHHPRHFSRDATPAGAAPAVSDLINTLHLLWTEHAEPTDLDRPVSGDTIDFQTGDKTYARGVITATDPRAGGGDNFAAFSFTASDETWYCKAHHVGLYPP